MTKKPTEENKKKKALGRGLEALLNQNVNAKTNTSELVSSVKGDRDNYIKEIPISSIESNPKQPRKTFDSESLHWLALSIKSQGILQPLIVQKDKDRYVLISGERRLKAAKIAELSTVPCIVKNIAEKDRLATSLIENIQRENLNPVELAYGIRDMQIALDMTQQDVAQQLGMSRPSIANLLRLLDLVFEVQLMVSREELPSSSARALVVLPPEMQIHAAERIARDGLSTRQAESLVKDIQETLKRNSEKKNRSRKAVSIDESSSGFEHSAACIALDNISDILTRHFGTKVEIRQLKEGGLISLRYFDDSDLDRLLELMGVSVSPI